MKIMLLVCFSAILFVSCDKPIKCDDSQLKEQVKEILVENDLKKFSAYNANRRILERHPELKNLDIIKNQPEHRSVFDADILVLAEGAYHRKNYDAIPKEIYSAVEEDYNIYMNNITPAIQNIRLNFQDDETQSCGCSASAVYPTKTIDITYTAQKNTDGQLYVEVFKN